MDCLLAHVEAGSSGDSLLKLKGVQGVRVQGLVVSRVAWFSRNLSNSMAQNVLQRLTWGLKAPA